MLSLIYLAIAVAFVAGFWKVFEKAGRPGWHAVVPFYNLMVFAELVGKPNWWGLLCCIPLLGIVPFVLLSLEMAKRFGKDQNFGFGLGLLGFVFYPMLGFSDAGYSPPVAS